MADTVTILSTSVHTGNGTQTLQSEKVKGDAYFGQSDGLHTVVVKLTDFIGTIKVQGSLESTPGNDDFFDINLSDEEFTVDVSGLVTKKVLDNLIYNVSETGMKSYNVTGNFVWLRADISNWQSGTISSIEMNR